ncbi:MAG: RNA-binding protein [Desulfobacter sp.]|nr:RNA-binding protein [Desulfobacter sp.]WDP85616.1 MAG: RNA-binding protein [Desulfobacter sp.]
MNIYVGNLAPSIDQNQLQSMFEEFGTVESVKLIKDRFKGDSKGFAFVEMPNNSEADKAVKALNKLFLEGKHIKVNQSTPDGKKPKKKFKKRRF